MLENEGKGQKKRLMIVEEDTVRMVNNAQRMFVFLLYLEPCPTLKITLVLDVESPKGAGSFAMRVTHAFL